MADNWGSFMQGLASRLTPAKENNDAQWLFRTMAQSKMAEAREKVAREHADRQATDIMTKQLFLADVAYRENNGYPALMKKIQTSTDPKAKKAAIAEFNALEKNLPSNIYKSGKLNFQMPIIPEVTPQPFDLRNLARTAVTGGAKIAGDVVGGVATGAGEVGMGVIEGAFQATGLEDFIRQQTEKAVQKRLKQQDIINAKTNKTFEE